MMKLVFQKIIKLHQSITKLGLKHLKLSIHEKLYQERDLKRLEDLKDSDLNQDAVSDIAFVIDLSKNALERFKEEIEEKLGDLV